MVTDHLPDRMGSEPIQSVKRSVIINTMQKSGGGGDGHGHGDGMCKSVFVFNTKRDCSSIIDYVNNTVHKSSQ